MIFYHHYIKRTNDKEESLDTIVKARLLTLDKSNNSYVISEEALKYLIKESFKLKKFLKQENLPSSSIIENIVEAKLCFYSLKEDL